MVIVRAHMMKGRSAALRRKLIEQVTAKVVEELKVPATSVRVLIVEIDPDNWGIAGVPASVARS